MPIEEKRSGYAYKEDVATASYQDNYLKLHGKINQLKIINDTAVNLQFSLNRESDTSKVDGTIKANEAFRLDDMEQGIGSIAIKGGGAYRLWAYH